MASRISEERDLNDGVADSEQDANEGRSFLNHSSQPRWSTKSRTSTFTRVMAVVNLVLGVILAASLAIVARSTTTTCPQAVAQVLEPYSPALEAIVPVIRKFKPDLIFQSETSDLVEEAWKKTLGASDGVVALGPEISAKLAKTSHESVASMWEPEKHVYGVSMYHQLHCLNRIRRSFYREKFFPADDDAKFNFHKNHCFDFLRQAIMCHGDVSMTYWWNKNYTTGLENGQQVHSDWYESLDLQGQAKNSSVFWDIEHSCRMFEPIEEWVKRYPPLPLGISFPDDPSQS